MLLLFLLPAVALALQNEYIVNGGDVDIVDFPWQGSFRTAAGSHTCGCVFVGSYWALTAAHCGGSSAYSAGFQNSNRFDVTVYGITEVTPHPSYGQGDGSFPYDFAVIEMSEEPIGENLLAVTVPPTPLNPGGYGEISGWGRTCGNCDLPTQLQGISPMPIISDAECSERYGVSSFNSDVHICVYNGEQGACNGDSGGPLVQGGVIVGLVSFGKAGCTTAYPTVYARVGAVHDWICSTSASGAEGC